MTLGPESREEEIGILLALNMLARYADMYLRDVEADPGNQSLRGGQKGWEFARAALAEQINDEGIYSLNEDPNKS